MWLFRCIICLLLFHLLLFGATYESFAQKYKGDVWCWGDSAGIDWTIPGSPINFISQNKGRSGTASICDSINNLILYSGYKRSNLTSYLRYFVYNKFHNLVLYGDSLFGEDGYHSALFIPKPDNDSIVYLFNNIIVGGIDPFGLYYSEINYKANNDSGIVTQKNIQLNNLPAFDGLVAVRHGNGKDWWLIFKDWDPTIPYTLANTFYVYLVDENGPALHHAQSIGGLHNDGGGHLLFNSRGDRLFHCTWQGLLQYFDFDRCTGLMSNAVIIENYHSSQPFPAYASIALSQDEQRLYTTTFTTASSTGGYDSLYQFDLASSNILSSKTPIFGMPNSTIGIGSLRLAPDGKIYIASAFENFYPYQDTSYNVYNTHLSVINYPDSLGLACDFQPFSFYLGGARTYYGLPNNPDYELGAWVGSPCDTLSVGLNPNPTPEASWMQAWYNHEWDMIHVNASKLQGKKGVLRLFDMEGRVVFEKQAEIISGGYFTTEINMSGLANGVYMVNLVTEKEKISGKVGKY